MAWILLVTAGLLEIAWAVGLKYTEGFTRLWPSLFVAIPMIGSFLLLAMALRTIPVGTAYAVWTGIGGVGTAVLGMILFDESHDWARIVCILLIISGVVGLQLLSKGS